MHVTDAMTARRSVKLYEHNVVIPPEDFKKMIELAALSPSAFNIQHWRFVHVTDKELRKKIRAVAWDQAQITDASDLVFVCADLKAWENAEECWKGAPDEVIEYMKGAIPSFYKGNEVIERDEALRSVGMAAYALMIAAQGMGYDTGPMIGFDANAVAEIINLPKNHIIGMAIVMGKKSGDAKPRVGKLPLEKILVENGF